MDGTLKCRCVRRERGYASWRFPSIIDGGAAAIPKWPEVSPAPSAQPRASSRPLSEFPPRRAGARTIPVCQVEVRPRAKFRSFPRKRECRSKIWVSVFAGTNRSKCTTARHAISLALLTVLAAANAAVAQTAVDLQLVLAVDASGSVDQIRFELQKRGYVAAFRHPRVLQAVRSGPSRAIGVSGDGSNNRGRPVTLARDEAVAAGIGINGLPILALEPDLDRYYHDSVIGGPGAFVIAARNYETFGDAILKKLIIEIAANDH